MRVMDDKVEHVPDDKIAIMPDDLPDVSQFSEDNPLIVTNKAGDSFPVYPGSRYKLLKSGVVQDTVTTKFVAVHESGWHFNNSEQARASALLRWRKARESVIDRLGVLNISGNAFEAWGDIIESMYNLAVNADKLKNPMSAVAAARFVGIAAGFYSERGGNPEEKSGESEEVGRLKGALRQLKPDQLTVLIGVFAQLAAERGDSNGDSS